jgi:Eukaryotic-type carbonic anhydrase
MSRRNCGDVSGDNCNDNRPPLVDYPKYTSQYTDYADLIHYDIKVPAEHQLEGEEFDAEIQMFTLHPADARLASIGQVIRATDNGHNDDLQEILDAFQETYDDHAAACQRRQLRQRHTVNDSNYTDTEVNTTTTATERRYLRFAGGNIRNLQQQQDANFFVNDNHDDMSAPFVKQMMRPYTGFNPFSEALFPTIFFYRYDGTLSEPPCTGISWFVMQEPVIISTGQLEQMKRLLFLHRDEDCQYTSVHNADQSVARPIFRNTDGEEVEECLDGSFKSDVDKGRLDANKCRS